MVLFALGLLGRHPASKLHARPAASPCTLCRLVLVGGAAGQCGGGGAEPGAAAEGGEGGDQGSREAGEAAAEGGEAAEETGEAAAEGGRERGAEEEKHKSSIGQISRSHTRA